MGDHTASNPPENGGKQSLYDPEKHLPLAVQLMSQGYTKQALAAEFGITYRTLRNWELKYPDFLDAIREGCTVADNAVQMALHKCCQGFQNGKSYFPPNMTGIIWWMKNRDPDNWRDKREVTAEVNLANMSEKDIVNRIKALISDDASPA